jgi:hypothetical protein
MDGLLEVRCTEGGAFEMRNGARLEFADDAPGQTRRLRSIGCPEWMIPKIIAKRNQQRNAPSRTLRHIDSEIARLNGLLAKKLEATPAKPVLSRDERIARVMDAVRVDRLNMATEHNRQYQADEELRRKMQNLAGITDRERKYQPN